jgi:hypothetical protein
MKCIECGEEKANNSQQVGGEHGEPHQSQKTNAAVRALPVFTEPCFMDARTGV